MSKILERLALKRLQAHILGSSNFCVWQSAYRTGHSTETALLAALNDVYEAASGRNFTVVVGLDISAAFDTIRHDTLLTRLQAEFGIEATALQWLQSYFVGRQQFVKIGNHSSSVTNCVSGVPQGSVLGPLLFAAYTSPVGDLATSHGIRCQEYADDTQLYLSMSAEEATDGLLRLSACTSVVKTWYLHNDLLLNDDKSDVIILGTGHQLKAVNDITSVPVADVHLPVATQFKSLGVVIDSRLTFAQHASSVVKSCHYHLRALKHIRQLLSQRSAETLACSLISSRLDYCNSLLYGAPQSTLDQLQRVQNATARVVTQSHPRSHAKPILKSLHWLPVKQRIEFKVALLTYKAHTTGLPSYLNCHLHSYQSERDMRSSSQLLLTVPNHVPTNFSRRGFYYAAPTIWNKLHYDVKSAKSLNVFKSRLKTFLFSTYFNCDCDSDFN